jgi:hypothetical protein
MEVQKDFRDLLELLNDHNVEFMFTALVKPNTSQTNERLLERRILLTSKHLEKPSPHMSCAVLISHPTFVKDGGGHSKKAQNAQEKMCRRDEQDFQDRNTVSPSPSA